MGKCLSCFKEDQSIQPNYTEDHITSDSQHHGTSSIPQPNISLGFITSRPSAAYKVHSPKEGRKFSSSSNASAYSFFSARRSSLFTRLQKNNTFLSQQQSRANFDSQEDMKSTDLFATFRSGRRFSFHKLSVVSCYKSTLYFEPQSSNQDLLDLNEIEPFSKNQSNTDAQKHKSFSEPKHSPKYFRKFETKATSPLHLNTMDRISCQQSMTSFFSHPTVIPPSNPASRFATHIQESGRLNKDRKDCLHPGSQSHSTNHSPAMTQQHFSEIVTFPVLCNVGLPLSYENTGNITPAQYEVNSGPFEEENFAISSQDEEKPSPTETATIRYITANTDTEEQSFPVPKPFNTHIEELKLDVLLQKADHLRVNESGKMESFELLCDHKEKFRDEIEFMWRFARAYGDMCELSTNAEEKKHYANIGKTLGERAITRAPLNGYCHLWYAVLCGCVSEFEGLQNKINYGHHFKEHLEVAIRLLPEEPFLYYLKGRYCYTISKLSWIEKKMAATLFGKIPSSTVQEALYNFLKAEELQPGFSLSNYMHLAKCYVDLGESQDAWKFCNLALLLPVVTKEDKEAHKELKKIISSLKRLHDFWKRQNTYRVLLK
ncbi:regulator of microtubule dynamics protein 2 isoform X1 [Castor canadensis]|uniref:Regulator of microtubule dynamics protein 2 isoform X1 n=2 Tax=Castor canadensis TaxID=51338 RepID=A0AC58KL37_CASCN